MGLTNLTGELSLCALWTCSLFLQGYKCTSVSSVCAKASRHLPCVTDITTASISIVIWQLKGTLLILVRLERSSYQCCCKSRSYGHLWCGVSVRKAENEPGEIRKPFSRVQLLQGGLSHCPSIVCPSCSEQEVKVQRCLLSITVHINRHRKIKSCCLALLPLDVLINILASYSV